MERNKPTKRKQIMYSKIRVVASHTDENYIYVNNREKPTEKPIKVQYNPDGEFASSVAAIRKNCRLNLLDVTVDENGIYIPQLIILEPDYLIDVSSLAECMKIYGAHPLNFVRDRFAPPPARNKHILLGNMANLFLDELVNEKTQHPVAYPEAVRKAFKASPLEFASCPEINEAFFQEAQTQFRNIQRVVQQVFPEKHIDREKAILEPNFICEDLGIHGRLDFLQLYPSEDGTQFVIELKAGKAPFPESNHHLIGKNHQAQTFLYQMMIQKVIGVEFSHLKTFVLYSKYSDPDANLRPSQPYMAAIKRIMNIRNLIVANERNIAFDDTGLQTRNIVRDLSPDVLITDPTCSPAFLERYIVPQMNVFKAVFENASEPETEYFHRLYAFVAKEHYLSKTGYREDGTLKGIASLWLATEEEKRASGDILTHLTIRQNLCETETPAIRLIIPPYTEEFLPNFRQGDIVILYERNRPEDNVTNKQIFKGSIRALSPGEITVTLRQRQRNPAVFPAESLYAVEHDFLDASYNAMYRGLYDFLQANRDRKELLLNLRPPTQNKEQTLSKHYLSPEIDEIVLQSKQANDYYLLSGPPGTGKTSIALKSMVEEFMQEPSCCILLLSYTNRAVDEMCDALDRIDSAPPYIRIGSEWACKEEHRKKLLHHVMQSCHTREQVKEKLRQRRIFAGTVASLSGKMELFELIHFQVMIVDEASQIPEPQILGILSAKDANDRNAVEKFILIGDHKQLPAIVLQKGKSDSLFERLYRLHKAEEASPCRGMLCKQGRMHHEIASFPNKAFYQNKLLSAGNRHQTEALDYFKIKDPDNPYQQLLCSKRLAFIPSEKTSEEKRNTHEAQIVTQLVENIHDLYQRNGLGFSAHETLGVITPYRSQIGLIKREIHRLGISGLSDITVDTVERFQGSQRDIIIYSVCANRAGEMDFITANRMEEDGQIIDRKLNVAITRAKKQLFITGHPSILALCPVYGSLMEYIRSENGYISF
ncbi:MAG: AAA family ATPase [Tannerellaceae bacterium]|nr:AAA family ATPase [Tannerellaceae bacterium]